MEASISQKAVQSATKKHKVSSLSPDQVKQAIQIASEIQQHIHASLSEAAYKEKIKLAQKEVLARHSTDNVNNGVLELAKSMAASERGFAGAKTRKFPELTVWQREIEKRITELWETEGNVTPVV